MRHSNIQASHRGAAGFTLVELMMVITIIALLAAILLPTVDAARIAAKNTATRSLLHSISAGLDMFKSEPKLGRQYPPSLWRTNGAGDTPDPGGDPYGVPGASYDAYGAQTLVWALAGADLLGTPGFQVDATSTPQISLDNTAGNLYHPASTRFGPFIDLSKTKIKTPVADTDDLTFSTPVSGGYGGAPVVVDDFNRPVLYFSPRTNSASGLEEYFFGDNVGLMDKGPGIDAPTFWTMTGFRTYTRDERVFALSGQYRAHNRDSFLLITAGRDLHYGTVDDIANFPFNPLP